MSDDTRKKAPPVLPDATEEDWENALSAWDDIEAPPSPAPKAKDAAPTASPNQPAASPRPTPASPQPAAASPKPLPVRQPPAGPQLRRPASATSQAKPLPIPRTGPGVSRPGAPMGARPAPSPVTPEGDESTARSRVPPEIMNAASGRAGAGSGLGQAFRREPPAAADTDALHGALFEENAQAAAPPTKEEDSPPASISDPFAEAPASQPKASSVAQRSLPPVQRSLPPVQRSVAPAPASMSTPPGGPPRGAPHRPAPPRVGAARAAPPPKDDAPSISDFAPEAPTAPAVSRRPTAADDFVARVSLSTADEALDTGEASLSPPPPAPVHSPEAATPADPAPPERIEPAPAAEAAEATEMTVESEDRPSEAPVVAESENALSWNGERDAAQHLAEKGEEDAWLARATWFEQEAQAASDRTVRARALLVASEIHAMIGDCTRAQALAVEARDIAPNHPMVHRQARSAFMRDGDWSSVAQTLQNENRTAPTPAAKVHGALLAAGIARLASDDPELSNKRLDQAMRASPTDPRPYLGRLATAIADGDAIPTLRWPDSPALAPIVAAFSALARWRGAEPIDDGTAHPIEALVKARQSIKARDAASVIGAVSAIGDAAGLRDGAMWLGAAVAAACPPNEAAAVPLLGHLMDGSLAGLARRALAAHGIKSDNPTFALSVLSDVADPAFSAADKVAIAALAKAETTKGQSALESLESDPDLNLLANAVRAATGNVISDVGSRGSAKIASPAVRLARLLSGKATSEEIATAVAALRESDPASLIAGVLSIELDNEAGRIQELAEGLSRIGGAAAEQGEQQRNVALISGLLFEISGDRDKARAAYANAIAADPGCEATVRAVIACSDPKDKAGLLLDYERSIDQAPAAALILLEAALSGGEGGDGDTYAERLMSAHQKAPSLPFAAWLAERRARARGDFDSIVQWVQGRREASTDPIEAAHGLVREALLIADREIEVAKELLQQASQARPTDLALRELYERISPEPPADRSAYWAERANEASGADRARFALLAAIEHEREGGATQAARLAEMCLASSDDALTRIAAERIEGGSDMAPNLVARLAEKLDRAQDPKEKRDLLERIATLEEAIQGDTSGAVERHRAILADDPGYVPSLARLESMLITASREADLVPVAAAIAKTLPLSPEATAHAQLATRLFAHFGSWQDAIDVVKLAFNQDLPPLWAVRAIETHAMASGDAKAALDAASQLAERTIRANEAATLSLRAAEAAMMLGDNARARDFLTRATELDPSNPIVYMAAADLGQKTGDHQAAAEAHEAIARLSVIPSHQVDSFHKAAVLWQDRVKDVARARAALEAAAEIDINFKDTFDRLRMVYTAAGDREALAALLEQRAQQITDPAERVQLEITRGRALADIGDSASAKRALAVALESSPDHVDALSAFADVCAKEQDWEGTEQSLIRLVRLIPDTSQQAAIYTRLGELYDQHMPNPERAELAYREVLKRLPADIPTRERLIDVYRRAGDSAKALEMQQALIDAAPNPATKRTRTIELAIIHEQVAKDVKKAESILEAVRKESPGDVDALGALVELHKRNNKEAAAQILLDRSATDARRALATGRFDPHLFAILAGVAKLRGNDRGAQIIESTVAALEGTASELPGAGALAAAPTVDDLVAPDLLTPAFRTLLRKSGEILDAAMPVDLRGLRAAPLPAATTGISAELRDLAESFGLTGLEAFVSPTLGAVCMPVGSYPPQIVVGASLLASTDEAVRKFLIMRALKVVQIRASAIARSSPIDLMPLVSAYLRMFAPDWQPPAVDMTKVDDMLARLNKVKPQRLDDDVGSLALEVIGTLGNRASTLGTVAYGHGNRTALLASGNLSSALAAIAQSTGHGTGLAASGPERITWIGRNAEARDLVLFTVTEAYAQARSQLGI
jgi:cellulose synthase operon protein C